MGASVSASDEDMSAASPEDDSSQAASTDSVIQDPTSSQEQRDQCIEQSSGESTAPASMVVYRQTPKPSPKRTLEQEPVQSPRKKFRRVSMELWRVSCQNACSAYDESLPTLEEAAQPFGFGQ